MAKSVLIIMTGAGLDVGPIMALYSDADGYAVPFESGILRSVLEAGYTSNVVPDAATIIRVVSTDGLCVGSYEDSIISTSTTTSTSTSTTTSTSTSTTTTTTTIPPTTTTTTTVPPTTTTTTTCPIPTLYLASTSNDACNQINGQFLIGISYTTTGTCYYCNWDTLNSTTIPSLADGTYYVSDGTNIRSWTKTSTPSQLYNPSVCSICPGVTTTTTTTITPTTTTTTTIPPTTTTTTTVPPTTTTTTTVAPPPPTTTTTTTSAPLNYVIRSYDSSCNILGSGTSISNAGALNMGYFYATNELPAQIVEIIGVTSSGPDYFTNITGLGYANCPDVPPL